MAPPGKPELRQLPHGMATPVKEGVKRWASMTEMHRRKDDHAGEGWRIMAEAPRGYWLATLFVREGRPWPRPLAFYALWAIASAALSMTCALDDEGDPTLTVDYEVLSLAGFALFFLIVFRTNAS
jgi:hypothetical protein